MACPELLTKEFLAVRLCATTSTELVYPELLTEEFFAVRPCVAKYSHLEVVNWSTPRLGYRAAWLEGI